MDTLAEAVPQWQEHVSLYHAKLVATLLALAQMNAASAAPGVRSRARWVVFRGVGCSSVLRLPTILNISQSAVKHAKPRFFFVGRSLCSGRGLGCLSVLPRSSKHVAERLEAREEVPRSARCEQTDARLAEMSAWIFTKSFRILASKIVYKYRSTC